jgi:acyl CoA:acetate/3-ketoacid CoA transferase alpha subunit/acyl CoA:acetate/3-ketoacid CoA transferase beta subunit
MLSKWSDFLDKTFTMKEYEGKNKVLDLSEAIKRHVKPGMTLYLGERSNALLCELIRRFYGSQAKFTIVMLFVIEQALNLVHCELVSNIITASCTELFPASGPSPIIQNAFKKKTVKIENWSLCALSQRLLAGALDVPFISTNSISSSSMAQENKDSFCQVPDPFGSGKQINLIKALKPDIALIHGWAADPAGNTIVAPSVIGGEYSYGAKASKNGVIVSVEQIVSTQFIREHSALVTIPAGIVNSVSLAELGAHPNGMLSDYGIKQFHTYVEDCEFTRKRRQASRDPQNLDNWVKNWILENPNHEEYLKKLGGRKILFLKEKGANRNWRDFLEINSLSYSPEYNSREMMVIAAARKTKELVLKNNYDGVLCGIGISGLPGWIAYYDLRKENYDINLWLGSGVYGFSPCPGDPQLFSLPTIMSARMLSNGLDAYGIFIGGNHNKKYMSILSAAQIDQKGSLNSTKISETSYIIGSGGSNDASNANEVLVVIPQSAKRFVQKVSYITCPGNTTKSIVSDMGIFERINGEFILTTYFPDAKIPDSQELINKIADNCGWELKISPHLTEAPAPSLEELIMLRAFDPKGYLIGSS